MFKSPLVVVVIFLIGFSLASSQESDSSIFRVISNINIRSGAGTTYEVVGSVRTGDIAVTQGQPILIDGNIWQELTTVNGSPVRGYIAINIGDADTVEFIGIATPTPTSPPPPNCDIPEMRSINESRIPSESITGREFDTVLGGFTEESSEGILVYRESMAEDVIVRDSVLTNNCGVWTLESQLEGSDFQWSEEGRIGIQNGSREFYIQSYILQMGVDREEAQRLYEADTPLEIKWTDNPNMLANSVWDLENENVWYSRQFIPSAGVSMIIMDEPIPVAVVGASLMSGSQQRVTTRGLPFATPFLGGPNVASLQYRPELTENGRLVIAVYHWGRSMDSSIAGWSYLTGILAGLRFISGYDRLQPPNTEFNMEYQQYEREVAVAFGYRDLHDESYADVTDFEAWSRIQVID